MNSAIKGIILQFQVTLLIIFWHVYVFNSFPLINVNIKYMSEKAMAPHSSTLAWKIPWMEEPGGLQSMGSLRVGHD